MERDSFIFYRSFSESIRELDPGVRCECYEAIVNYALDGAEPNADGVVMAMFRAFKPQIDANNKRYENGKKGGRPKTEPKPNQNQTITKPKPNDNQTVTDPKPNVNVNVNVNENIYIHIRDMYNKTCVSFPKVTTLSEKRKKALGARLKVYTVDDFQTLFTKAESSDFLKGSNSRNWSATFDWLIADGNMAKVLDGNYDNRRKAGFEQREHNFSELESILIAN
jgi:hypothetical protein